MNSTQLATFVFAAVAAIASAVAAGAAVFAIFQARDTSRGLSSIRDSLRSMLDRIEHMATTLGAASTRLDQIGQDQAATAETVKQNLAHARTAHDRQLHNEQVQALLRLRSLVYRLRQYADPTLLDEEAGMRLREFVWDFQAIVAYLGPVKFERCWDASRKIGVFKTYLPPPQGPDRWQVTSVGLLNQALAEIDAALPL